MPSAEAPEDSITARIPDQALTSIGRHGPVGLLDGTELVGEFLSSGYREPPRLAQRADGQLVRLPAVLYQLTKALQDGRTAEGAATCETEQADPEQEDPEQEGTEQEDPETGGSATGDERATADHEPLDDGPPDDGAYLAGVAERAARETGMPLTIKHIVFLLDQKLAPLGVTTYADGTVPELRKHTPFLALRVRKQLLSGELTSRIGGWFAWLFSPVLIALLVGLAGVAEWWVFGTQDIPAAIQQTLLDPYSLLAVIGLAIVSTAFHEFGHSAACRYSGVEPGGMGCGIYLVWPAFYTDINNSYRLSRTGRLRTDLGGVYFNAIFLLLVVEAYLLTGWEPLLVAVLSLNLEMIQQLLPTLRFDGYYIVSDLVGIPDLFKYIGPILRRAILRRGPEPVLTELKRWPQLVVTCWVLVVLPALALQLGYIAWQIPGILRTEWNAIVTLAETFGEQSVVGIVSAVVQIFFLLLPAVGVSLILFYLSRLVFRLTRRARARRQHTVSAPIGHVLGSVYVPRPAPEDSTPEDSVPDNTASS